MSHALWALALLIMGCSCEPSGGRDVGPGDASSDGRVLPDVPPIDAPRADVPPPDAPACMTPPTPAGPEVELAPAFRDSYAAFNLGPVPGVPSPLGGIVVSAADPNRLIVAGASERPEGALYAIEVTRDSCGHILGFVGTATRIATAPYVDANLVYGPGNLLVYTEWPQYTLSQLAPGATTPSVRTNLTSLGLAPLPDQGPGGIGYVPPGLMGAGTLRIVTWPEGRWYHVAATLSGGLYTIDGLTEVARISTEPGGFAYVPAGSPGFDRQSLIMAEWRRSDRTLDRVAVFEVDEDGDPVPASRREFFSRFPRPWGAYFEPITGDYLFLTWGDGDDRAYIVQGFVPPPKLF
jgi:hypothetical protein